MKKTIFAALAAGALVLAGCTKTEVTEVPEGKAISFENYVANSVKSLDKVGEGENALNKFFVYGGETSTPNLFAGREVTYSGGEWGYSPAEYWVDGTDNYNFAAYSNENASVSGVTYDSGTSHHLSFTYTTDGHSDLVYAYSHDADEDNNPVSLEFGHVLSKVVFVFDKSETLNGSELTISGVTVTGTDNKGTFTGKDRTPGEQFGADVWSSPTSSSAVTVNFESTLIDDANKTIESQPLFLIPQATNDAKVKTVTFTLTPTGKIAEAPYNVKEKTFPVELPSTSSNSWLPGHVYTYTAEISAQNFEMKPIEFTVSISNWTDGEVTDGDDILLDTNTGTGN